jgi:hypothetical protein
LLLIIKKKYATDLSEVELLEWLGKELGNSVPQNNDKTRQKL